MLEVARLVGTHPKEIILQTREGRCVKNEQSCEPDARIRVCYDRIRRDHLAWVDRKPACGVYNCFGLIWASRRTSIYDESEISKILTDDGYRQLATDRELQPGDVVLYRLPGNTLHAAMVMELRQLHSRGPRVPWVLSKWGSVFGEDLHPLMDVPRDIEGCLVEFWTDRPL